jgi:hypothetical protein
MTTPPTSTYYVHTYNERTTPYKEGQIMQLDKWHKNPSVTTGGKRYFFSRREDDKQLIVVWDRVVLAYACQIEGKTIDYTSRAADGMRSIDNHLAHSRRTKC